MLLVVALVDAYGVIGLLFASTLAMAIESCLGRLLLTHPQAARREQTLPELRQRIEGTRRRLLLLPERNATSSAAWSRAWARSPPTPSHSSAEPVARVSADRAT